VRPGAHVLLLPTGYSLEAPEGVGEGEGNARSGG
jgi:hypothetical protein